jgi:hypothetical protein
VATPETFPAAFRRVADKSVEEQIIPFLPSAEFWAFEKTQQNAMKNKASVDIFYKNI